MPLASDDRRFANGVGVALGALLLYAVAIRAPFRAASARKHERVQKLQSDVDRFFRNPKASPFTSVETELRKTDDTFGQILGSLVDAVQFDPGPLSPSGETGGDPAEAPGLYFKLSGLLHDRVNAASQQAPHLVRIPRIFDPQGQIQTPSDPALVPRLHRQLIMAYGILRAAIEHRVDILELRAVPSSIEAHAAEPYLEEFETAVKAHGALDGLAAFLHALSQPPKDRGGSRCVSVSQLAITFSEADPEKVQYTITFTSVRANPGVDLAAGVAKPATPTPRKPTRRPAPVF